ncbi:hypothetical protein [Deinococcus sp.]|uniref:hypothetical protein n=1 Tax=Deinococcus sp. TaxID=47478 RepID=UPI0025EA6944|nr:hypothetical protein [Deinococcus sp.]
MIARRAAPFMFLPLLTLLTLSGCAPLLTGGPGAGGPGAGGPTPAPSGTRPDFPVSSASPALFGSEFYNTDADRSGARVPGSPDVLIFGISGRCGPPCQAPQDDWDYLSERGTLDAIAGVFAARGLKVEVRGYAERLARTFQSRRSALPQRGVLDLISDYGRLTSAWTVGRPAGTRVILVGHSHGSVWGHYLSALYPRVPVAALIDLDTNCVAWSADHGSEVRAELRAAVREGAGQAGGVQTGAGQIGAGQTGAGQPALPELSAWKTDPLRSPLRACGKVSVRDWLSGDGLSGDGLAEGKLNTAAQVNLKDLVLPNVALNLEVQSKRWPARPIPAALAGPGSYHGGLYVNYLFDLTPNRRPGGSRTDIATFISVREDHSAVSYPGSTALSWVKDQLGLLDWLPPLQAAKP